MPQPSGAGQTTKAQSLSVVRASDGPGTVSEPALLVPPDRTTWTLPQVRGTIAGPVLALDPDPNVTDPGALAIRVTRDLLGLSWGSFSIIGSLEPSSAGGVSLQPWIYDDVRGLWFKVVGAPVAVNQLTTVVAVGGGLAGAKFFCQITANTLCKQFWLFIR